LPIKTQYQQYHIPILYKGWLAWFAKFNGHKSMYKTPTCEINRKVPNIGLHIQGEYRVRKIRNIPASLQPEKKLTSDFPPLWRLLFSWKPW